MTDKRKQYEDRLIASALREKLGGRRPPDLTERVMDAANETSPRTADIAARRWARLRAVSLLAISASLLLAVALASWMFSDDGLEVDLIGGSVAWHSAIASHESMTTAKSEGMYEGVLVDSYTTERGRQSQVQNNLKQINLATQSDSERELRRDYYRYTEGELPMLVDNSQSLPSPYYMSDDVQYVAPADKWKAVKALVGSEGKTWADSNFLGKELERLETVADNGLVLARGDIQKELKDIRAQLDAAPADPKAQLAVVEQLQQLEQQIREDQGRGPGEGGDKYERIVENQFLRTLDNPLSTFSIDVDTASYSKTRMYLLQNRMLPPPDAVRIEELVNYFDYDYDGPTDEHPFAAHLEAAECPWNAKHRLVRIALKGKEIEQERPASNLVFLLDVSGSMDEPNKLPLVQNGMSMLVRQLGENDRVAIVVYAGAAGLVLPSTPGSDQAVILESINRLHAGGSTNGGEGIRLAYQTALDHFIAGGVNRVILCTDGDFNVGVTSPGDITRLAEENAKAGVYLSILGFGMGNHNDAMLEEVSNKANGNYAFIDTENEARKVLVEQMNGTLVTIAKDVKIQVEFNPAQVAAYRLLGYENRMLAAEDFNDDKKDAGEIGAGHTVTALYEIVPVDKGNAAPQPSEDAESATPPAVDDLKYQSTRKLTEDAESGELLTLKLRYKKPDADISTLMTQPLAKSDGRFSAASRDFQFAASVAAFGMILRGSQFKGDATLDAVQEIAESAKGPDRFGYRAELLDLVKAAKELGAR